MLDPVELDDDPNAVWEQKEEVHPLPLEKGGPEGFVPILIELGVELHPVSIPTAGIARWSARPGRGRSPQ